MLDLFRSEWRRFQKLVSGFALAHFLLVVLIARVSNPLQWPSEDQTAVLLLGIVYGLLLAMLQFGSYRTPSQWLWLIHRPLPLPRIFESLCAAAALLLALGFALPLLVWLLATDLFSTQVVDSRHYVSLLHLWLLSVAGWLTGALVQLAQKKWLLAVLALPLVFAVQMISVWTLLLPMSVCLLWLFFIARQAFRANREASVASHAVLVMMAFPVQLGAFLLVFHVGKEALDFAHYLLAAPRQELQMAQDIEAEMRKESLRFVQDGLLASTDAQAALWQEQLPLVPMLTLYPGVARFPVRHQFGNTRSLWWDEQRGIEWVFSHDQMQFVGRDPRSGEAKGFWGVRGRIQQENFVAAENRYPSVPVGELQKDRWLIAHEDQSQDLRLKLPEGEQFIAHPQTEAGLIWVLSNQALKMYRLPANAGDDAARAPLEMQWQLPLPGPAARLAQVQIAEMLDGWLLSFHFFDAYERFFPPWQQLRFVSKGGGERWISERRDLYDYRILTGAGGSPLLPMEAWWLSPALHNLVRFVDSRFERGGTRPPAFEWWPEHRPSLVAGLALMALSGLGAALYLRKSNVGRTRRRIWWLCAALGGLPALLSLWLLERRESAS